MHHFALLSTLLLVVSFGRLASCATTEEECEAEEETVEGCARQFLIYRNGSLPGSIAQVDTFCRENKAQEACLSAHSLKCLSHSANQAITELIRSMSKQNRAICANKNSRWLYSKTNRCINSRKTVNPCYGRFVDAIHGLHQFGQEEKMPVICCSYVSFSNCLTAEVKGCGADSGNAIRRLVHNYAGETLSFVCRDYKTAGKCTANASRPPLDRANIKEAVPQSFFSLLVKIYLS